MPTQRGRNAVPSSSRTVQREGLISRRFAVRLAFDGTTYRGFQSQPYKNTIQDQIEHRLRGLLRRETKVIAWGRTDAGVHAKGAVVTVDLTLDEVEKFAGRTKEKEGEAVEQRAAAFLHSVLKEFACNCGETVQSQTRYGSISARNVTPVPSAFDARYSARWKRYVYYVCAGDAMHGDQLPFVWSRYAWHVRHKLDLDMMQRAAEMIDGEHNFEWMSVVQRGELRDPRRRVQLSVEAVPLQSGTSSTPYFLQQSESMGIYKISCTCDFFLYQMARRIVGIIVALGKGDVGLDELQACLEAYDNDDEDDATRTRIKIPPKLLQTAPAKGLCLEHIEYDLPI